MRILVDTSIWVDFLNGFSSPERTTLATLLKNDHDLCTCGVVIAEVYRSLRARGLTVRSTIDCLIAVLAEENGAVVLARDRDMKTILESGLVAASLYSVTG